jgi:nucleoside-diphosphate-sugar epimerase
MHIVIIGGTGHVGTYLVPRLVSAGHQVTCVTRGTQPPYHEHPAWKQVRRVTIDREQAERDNEFGPQIIALQPDVVIDMICFTVHSARQMVEHLAGEVQHFLHCGTIWVYGHSVEVPAREDQPRHPFGEYGIQKSAIQDYLLTEARLRNFPATIVQPGHIMGPGWEILTPTGNRNQATIQKIARGEEITLPNLGMETLHHVHADDVAQVFERAINHWSVSVGEAFHAVASSAVTLRGYAEAMYCWFGHEPRITYLAWDEWQKDVTEQEAAETWDHIAHSPNASVEKARRLLGYEARYTSLEAVYDALRWQIEQGLVQV